jgi:hypothetical protein
MKRVGETDTQPSKQARPTDFFKVPSQERNEKSSFGMTLKVLI